jgi:hypothetical protein
MTTLEKLKRCALSGSASGAKDEIMTPFRTPDGNADATAFSLSIGSALTPIGYVFTDDDCRWRSHYPGSEIDGLIGYGDTEAESLADLARKVRRMKKALGGIR